MRSLRGRLRAVRTRSDDGQLLLLVLGYAVIAALLVTVVVNLSQAFLYRRALLAAADAAALAAANEPDLGKVYQGGAEQLPLSGEGAERAVRQYARDAQLAARFNGFRVVGVDTDGVTVTVTLAADVPMPLINLVSSEYRDGYPVDATAHATSPLLP